MKEWQTKRKKEAVNRAGEESIKQCWQVKTERSVKELWNVGRYSW